MAAAILASASTNKVILSSKVTETCYVLTGVCSRVRWLPGVITAPDDLPIAIVCLFFVAVMPTVVATGRGVGPAGAMVRGLLAVPPPLGPCVLSTSEVGTEVEIVGGGTGGVVLCDVGMVSLELAREGNRGREMVRGGREWTGWDGG